jgi:hypothetical protein
VAQVDTLPEMKTLAELISSVLANKCKWVPDESDVEILIERWWIRLLRLRAFDQIVPEFFFLL